MVYASAAVEEEGGGRGEDGRAAVERLEGEGRAGGAAPRRWTGGGTRWRREGGGCVPGGEREGGAGGGGGRRQLTDPRVAAAEGWSAGTLMRLVERQGVSALQEVVETDADTHRRNGRQREEGEDV